MAERPNERERREESHPGAAVPPATPPSPAAPPETLRRETPRGLRHTCAPCRPPCRLAGCPAAVAPAARPRSPEGGPLTRSPAVRGRRAAAPFIEELLEQGGSHAATPPRGGPAAPLAVAQRAASGGGRGSIPGAAAEPPSIPRRRKEAKGAPARSATLLPAATRHLTEGRNAPGWRGLTPGRARHRSRTTGRWGRGRGGAAPLGRSPLAARRSRPAPSTW